jgi:thymidylate kinase
MNSQLILIDGIPGSGKSVVAQTIDRLLRGAEDGRILGMPIAIPEAAPA